MSRAFTSRFSSEKTWMGGASPAMTRTPKRRPLFLHFFAFRFLADFLAVFFAVFFFAAALFGTFFPSALASERPIAIACLRLVTFLPDRPLFRVPAFITR